MCWCVVPTMLWSISVPYLVSSLALGSCMVFAITPFTASIPVAPALIPMVPFSWNTQSKI
ncbi:hypothetical protein D3C87_2151100 [compost metagenome]